MIRLWTRDYIIFCISSLVMYFAFYSLVSSLPIYLDEVFAAKNWEIGIILSSYAFAALLLRPFCGYVLDAWGRKWVFLGGFFVFCLLFGAYMLPLWFYNVEDHLWTRGFLASIGGISIPLILLAVVRFLHGLSWAIVTSGSQTIMVDLVPFSRRGEGIAFSGLAVSLSMAVGPALGLWLLHLFGGNKLFLITMVMSLLSFGAVCFMKFPHYRASRAKINLRAMVERTSIPISVVCMLNCFSNATALSYVAIYCKELENTDPGTFFFIYALAITLSRLFTGKLFDRYGPTIPMGISYPCLIIAAILMGLAHGPVLLYTGAMILGTGSGIIYPCFVTCINNMVRPTRRGAANATYSSAIDMGIGPGIIFFGILSTYTGLRATFFVSAGFYLLSYLLYFLLAERHYARHKITEETVT